MPVFIKPYILWWKNWAQNSAVWRIKPEYLLQHCWPRFHDVYPEHIFKASADSLAGQLLNLSRVGALPESKGHIVDQRVFCGELSPRVSYTGEPGQMRLFQGTNTLLYLWGKIVYMQEETARNLLLCVFIISPHKKYVHNVYTWF